MKRKRHIAYWLLFVSMIMLVVPVIPHHHHTDGLLCMKNDLTEECCNHHHDAEKKEHCCCDTGCLTTHFFQKTPSTDHQAMTAPDFPLWVMPLFFEPILSLLLLPDDEGRGQDPIYIESLHGTFITRAAGLRAPPAQLA